MVRGSHFIDRVVVRTNYVPDHPGLCQRLRPESVLRASTPPTPNGLYSIQQFKMNPI